VTLFEAAAGSAPLLRLRLAVAYDGRGFHGFAAQPGVATVAGTLGDALERVLGHPVALTCAGRTDTGVHARGQVVHCDTTAALEQLDLGQVQRGVNALCAPQIVVGAVDPAPPGFDARRSAKARRYRYTVLNREVPDPFLAATTWHVPEPIDRGALALSCDPIIGEHDFTSFCRVPRGTTGYSMTRRVIDARWTDAGGDLVWFEIESSSFCHQMVRAIVGTMVAIGRGRRKAGEMAGILRARDRAAAGDLAPPHALCLWDVRY
jgi:tRNA pseudouridine38-40 synthase